MSRLTFSISMSLDGFITGPDPGPDAPLGRDGERIHEWVVGTRSWRERHGMEGGIEDESSAQLEEQMRSAGAILMGRGMFDAGEPYWGDEPPFGVPVFVVTHRGGDAIPKQGGTTYHFVTDGIEAAFDQARAAAGDRDVAIAGGANVIQQCLRAGLVDEFTVSMVPLLFGDGVRLFEDVGSAGIEIERARVLDSPAVTHLTYRVVK